MTTNHTPPPDADEIEQARNLVEIEGMAVGFDRAHPYWRLLLAADTLLRALDAERAKHEPHDRADDRLFCLRSNLQDAERESDALRAELDQARKAIDMALCDHITNGVITPGTRIALRAALNPTPRRDQQPDAEEDGDGSDA